MRDGHGGSVGGEGVPEFDEDLGGDRVVGDLVSWDVYRCMRWTHCIV